MKHWEMFMKFEVVGLTALAMVSALGGNVYAALPNGVAAGDVTQDSALSDQFA
jgi:alkaline phosphatase D